MNIKNLAIGIVIIILTLFVVIYGINTFYEKPEYQDFCGNSPKQVINNESACLDAEGKWNPYNTPSSVNERQGYCDTDYYCRENYNNARENYYKHLFLIALPLGIIIILIGLFVFSLEAVGAGLIGGGILTILYGVGGYWQYTGDLLKFILTLIALIVIIWAAYLFNKKGWNPFKFKK